MAKYKVNQYVTVSFLNAVHVFQIFEIVEITCCAGTQTMYTGRLNGVDDKGGFFQDSSKVNQKVEEIEITGTAEQKDVWEAAAKIRAEK